MTKKQQGTTEKGGRGIEKRKRERKWGIEKGERGEGESNAVESWGSKIMNELERGVAE